MNREIFAFKVKNEGDPLNYLDVNNAGITYATDTTLNGIRPNGRNDYLLIYVNTGKISVTKNNRETILGEKHFVIYKPFEPQRYSYIACKDSEIFWIHFNGVFVERILSDLSLTKFYSAIRANNMLTELFHNILKALKEKKQNHKTVCNYCFLMILNILSENSISQVKNKIDDKKQTINNLLITIDSNISEYYSTSQLAKLCNLAPSTFIKTFKSVTGVPPITYLNNRKLENAAYLLAETDYSVLEISQMQGFQNQFYFSKAFKKKYKSSPTNYRANFNH